MVIWNLKRFYKKMLVVGAGKTNYQKVLLFLYSIVFGLVAALTFVAFFEDSPFYYAFDGIRKTFADQAKIELAMSRVVVLALAGMAVGVGYKSGLFNIGVSGQMIAGGMTAGLIALELGSKVPNGLGQLLVVFVSLSVGALFAGLAGLLKAYFNIHEVVSTILLNWIAFFFMKWMLDPNTSTLLGETMQTTRNIHPHYLLRIDDSSLWPTISIMIATCFSIYICLYKLKLGMTFKMTSLNPDASKYAGINPKRAIILAMMLSGAIAGLLGAVLYFGVQSKFFVPFVNVIPIQGFNGIAVSIIAYSNPFVIIIVALLFGIVQQGIVNTAGAINSSFIPLVLGILMYIAAISRVFLKLQWIRWWRRVFYDQKQNALYDDYKQKQASLDDKYYNEYSFAVVNNKKWRVFKNYLRASKKLKQTLQSALARQNLNQSKGELFKSYQQRQRHLFLKAKAAFWQTQIIEQHKQALKNLQVKYVLSKNEILTFKQGAK